jgi:FkbM family methyltransferase
MLDETEAYGLKFRFPAKDSAVGACLRDHGEFARPELDFLLACAKAATGTLVDVGAHIGSLCLPFAAARPSWRVIAVEAHPELAQLVHGSAERNGLSNVQTLAVAAGEAPGLAEFPAVGLGSSGNFGTLGFRSDPSLPRRPVGVRPLDDIAPDDTRLVKVDVEGFEPQVLRGGRRVLRELRPVWLIETHRKDLQERQEVAALLHAEGYRLFWFFSPFATFAAPRGQPQDPGRGDLGLIALPPKHAEVWPLPLATDFADPPGDSSLFSYLRHYGYP